jgi:hypothetical protein
MIRLGLIVLTCLSCPLTQAADFRRPARGSDLILQIRNESGRTVLAANVSLDALVAGP